MAISKSDLRFKTGASFCRLSIYLSVSLIIRLSDCLSRFEMRSPFQRVPVRRPGDGVLEMWAGFRKRARGFIPPHGIAIPRPVRQIVLGLHVPSRVCLPAEGDSCLFLVAQHTISASNLIFVDADADALSSFRPSIARRQQSGQTRSTLQAFIGNTPGASPRGTLHMLIPSMR